MTEKETIPVGCKHKSSNPGSIKLDLLEVQSGNYLDENDIILFEDFYSKRTMIN